ncbi:MAG TPA: hypothetical protein VJ898_09590 [Natrialbaceae archaeon]|nr:hypothetical protein [Natrialbaceae archaeon]
MSLLAIESLGELLALVVSAVGTLAFTAVGTIAEQAALQNLLSGQVVLGAWEAGMGAIALVVGVWILGYGKLWPRIAESRQSS